MNREKSKLTLGRNDSNYVFGPNSKTLAKNYVQWNFVYLVSAVVIRHGRTHHKNKSNGRANEHDPNLLF